MSRVGRRPITIPNNVTVKIEGNTVSVEGPKGKLSMTFSPLVEVKKEDNQIVVSRLLDEKIHKSLQGVTRTTIFNMIKGVSEGFQKELEIVGVGYSAKLEGKKLIMRIGFSKPVEYTAPEGIEFEVKKAKNFSIIVKGIDKQKVGEVADELRKFSPPDPYKGKGIRYEGEAVKLKQGKAGASRVTAGG